MRALVARHAGARSLWSVRRRLGGAQVYIGAGAVAILLCLVCTLIIFSTGKASRDGSDHVNDYYEEARAEAAVAGGRGGPGGRGGGRGGGGRPASKQPPTSPHYYPGQSTYSNAPLNQQVSGYRQHNRV